MSMKIVMWVLGGILIAGAGTYAAMSMDGEAQVEKDTADTNTTGVTSISALLSLPIPQKCEFTDETGAAKTSGTVYVSGGKMRGDFVANAAGTEYHAHTIMDGATAHSWVDETKIGVKSAMSVSSDTAVSSNQGLDASKNLEYRCVPWIPDTAVFELPTNISFIDAGMSAGAGASGSAGAGMDASVSVCAQCEKVPEAYRAQCRVAAGC
ncbi:MAG: hypothetical protein V4681_01610 [Patescibacteria group bacterium]